MAMGFSCMVQSVEAATWPWDLHLIIESEFFKSLRCSLHCVTLFFFICLFDLSSYILFTSWKSLNVGDALHCWQLIPDLWHVVSILGLQLVGSTHTGESERVWDFPSAEMWSPQWFWRYPSIDKYREMIVQNEGIQFCLAFLLPVKRSWWHNSFTLYLFV